MFHSTENLILDLDGILFTRSDDDLVRLGHVEDAEPEGLEAEHAEILDLWQDAKRWDPAAEVRATYYQGL